MDATVSLNGEKRAALLEMLRNLSTIFWGPDLEKCREMLSKNYFKPTEVLKPVPGFVPTGTLAKFRDQIHACGDEKALFTHLEEAYIPLFVNARGGVAAPLYQSCYPDATELQTATALMGEPAVRMKQRFASKGLALDRDLNEPPDHLAIEIEYLYFLLQKGWAEGSAPLLSEATAFAQTELLAWIPRFEERLGATAADSFYSLAAAILVATLRLVAEIQLHHSATLG